MKGDIATVGWESWCKGRHFSRGSWAGIWWFFLVFCGSLGRLTGEKE
jgi:hypothetical protein